MADKIKAKGTKATLIDEIVALKKKQKDIDNQITEKRAKIAKMKGMGEKAAVYITDRGSILDIQARSSYSAIKASDLLKKLKEKRKGKLFPSCVSVVLKDTLKHLSQEEIDSMRKKGADTYSWTFK